MIGIEAGRSKSCFHKIFWKTKYQSFTCFLQALNSPYMDIRNFFLEWIVEKSTILEDKNELDWYFTEPCLKEICTVIDY